MLPWPAPCLEIRCLLPGQDQGCTVTGTRALWLLPSSVLWWFSVISPHYGTLDQKADEMEVLGRWLQTKSAWGQTTGPDETKNGDTVPPPLLPAPEKLSPGHNAEKKKKEGKHRGSLEFCNDYDENKQYLGEISMYSWDSFCCLPTCSEGQHQNISAIFLNVNKVWMRWFWFHKEPWNIYNDLLKKKKTCSSFSLFYFNLFYFTSVIIRIKNHN